MMQSSLRALTLGALSLRCFATTVFPILGLLACSAIPEQNRFGESGAGGRSVDGAGGGGNGGGETGGGDFFDASNSGAGGKRACASATAEAKLVPLSLFLAVDRSGSMVNNDRFKNAQTAFTSFFQDPNAAGLNVALRFWPDDKPKPSDPKKPAPPPDVCSGDIDPTCGAGVVAVCAKPDVGIGPLGDPKHVKNLIDAFPKRKPMFGETPMYAALAGATTWAETYAAEKGNSEKVAIVLVTDGEPTSCGKSHDAIVGLAKKAYDEAAVPTFVVGVGLAAPGYKLLDKIAAAGNSDKAFVVDDGDTTSDLLTALKTIQGSAVSCSFKVPSPASSSEDIDYSQVDVNYAPAGKGAKQVLSKVESAAQCAAGGWYYDDPKKPATITLCPSTCALVQADTSAKVEIFFHCIGRVH